MSRNTTAQDHIGGPVAWRSAGAEGTPAAVFLHGLGGHRFSWEPQLEALSDLRRCCAWDLPGYGDSPGLPGSLPELAELAAAWIRELGAGPVDVVGLSFGGMVAQHLVLDHPHLVRTLALLDTSPAFGLDGKTTPEAWLASRVDPVHASSVAGSRAEDVIAGLVGSQCSDDVRTSAVASMQAIPHQSLQAACRALVRHDTRGRLHAVTAPTVVLVGAEDTETPPAYAETIVDLIPDSRLVVIPGSGHLVNLEAPGPVNDVLRGLWSSAVGVPV